MGDRYQPVKEQSTCSAGFCDGKIRNMKTSKLKTRQVISDHTSSKLAKYQDLIIGKRGLFSLIKYELIVLMFSATPGALGLFLRRIFYPMILKHVGKNVVFGSRIVLRHPHKISIGNDVIIDDNCLLDAKGADNEGIVIGNGVFLGRNTILSCKNGSIYLKDGANIGFNCELFSSHQVVVGENTMIAAYTYLVGSTYDLNRVDISFAEQDVIGSENGIRIGASSWLGSHVKVLDGVTIGDHVVIGAGALVRDNIPDYSLAVGMPAHVLRSLRPTTRDTDVPALSLTPHAA